MTDGTEAVADATTRAVLGIDAYLKRVEPTSEWGHRAWRQLALATVGDEDRREGLEVLRRLDETVEDEELKRWRRWFNEVPALTRSLRRLASGESLRDGDFFEVKRFLYQGKRLVEAAASVAPARSILVGDLAANLRGDQGEQSGAIEGRLAWLDALLSTIHPGHAESSRFHLADELEAGLGAGRDRRREAKRTLRRHRSALEEKVVERWGGRFDLRGRYQADDEASGFERDEHLEAVDGIFRAGDEALQTLREKVEELDAEVTRLEGEARRRLTEVLARERAEFEAFRERLGEFDRALTKVALRRRLQGCWPKDGGEAWLSLEEGRSPELVDQMGAEAVQPITAVLERQGAVVLGPNMGGKSAFLRLLGLSVWCAQMGLCLPAKAAAVGDVDRLVYVGSEEPRGPDGSEGLSAFGREVQRLVDLWETKAGRTLWLLDEPCRGTHPREGAQLAQSIVRQRLERGDLVVVATHFPELAQIEGLKTLEVRGLVDDEAALQERLEKAKRLGKSLKHALREAMDFGLEESDEARVPRDGQRVARALGLEI